MRLEALLAEALSPESLSPALEPVPQQELLSQALQKPGKRPEALRLEALLAEALSPESLSPAVPQQELLFTGTATA